MEVDMAEVLKKAPPQSQNMPGEEAKMRPEPQSEDPNYKASNKLKGKIALITGADSGIGKAVAIAYAKEGADIVISYLCEHEDAEKTKVRIEQLGRRCLLIPGDIGNSQHCKDIIQKTLDQFGKIDILVNNAAEQHQTSSLEEISDEQLERVFRTNIFSIFYLTKAALPHLQKGSTIINTTSVVAYKGNPMLPDYTATKGAITALTRALSQSLIKKGIRVNGVAPGPIWTPLIPGSFEPETVAEFGQDVPMQRPGQPWELAPAYVYLANYADSSYVNGQILHVNGGTVVNG
jgi:NAD(P)-dependent dehydrogenase (short-subunit alcohol dehydrogenase family)